jgi:hypothetical protein
VHIFKNYKSRIILFLIIPLISLFGSIYQAVYTYDSFHWGLLLFTGELINLGGKIYKDVFVHYGPLTTFLEALILKIFNNNIIYIFVAVSIFYSLSILLIQLFINKITDYKYAFIASLIIFFTHPFIISPWHNYTIFFIFNIYIFLKTLKNTLLENFSYFFLGLSILFSESFLYPCLLIFAFDILIHSFKNKLYYKNIKINLIKFIFFISPIIFFFIYLLYEDLLEFWLLHHSLPQMYLRDVLRMSFYDLFYNFFYNIFNYSFRRFFHEPQWFFYLILIILNIFYFIKTINNFSKIRKKNENLLLLLISFSSLVFLYNTLHNFAIFKFASGTIIGLIILIKKIESIKKIDTKIIIITFIFLLTFLGFEFIKNNSNLLYVSSQTKKESLKNSSFIYFDSQKWDDDTWNNLIFLEKNLLKISKACNVKYSANLSSDGFYSVILRRHLITDQKLPWYENKDKGYMNKYYNSFFNKFDNNFYLRTQDRIKNNEIIMTANKENFPTIEIQGQKIKLENKMKFIDIPYSYNHKKKIILIPNNCFY